MPVTRIGSVDLVNPAVALSVHCCHGCGARARRLHEHSSGALRACTDSRCDFHHGWRLEPAAHHELLLEVDGPNTVYAVPVDVTGVLLLALAVLWPGKRR